jgi:hypothetical protein
MMTNTNRGKKEAVELVEFLARTADVHTILDLASRIYWEETTPGVQVLVPQDVKEAVRAYRDVTVSREMLQVEMSFLLANFQTTKEAFVMFDLNHSGFIELAELSQQMIAFGQTFSLGEIRFYLF